MSVLAWTAIVGFLPQSLMSDTVLKEPAKSTMEFNATDIDLPLPTNNIRCEVIYSVPESMGLRASVRATVLTARMPLEYENPFPNLQVDLIPRYP
jgi:hypothetical protein